jgi:hypothetical protein
MRRGVLWHATAKTFFGGTGAEATRRPQGGRTWILPREPLDHKGRRRRRDGGRDVGHGHKRQGLSRASGRAGEKEGPSPGKSTKPTPKAWASEARGLSIAGRAAPQGTMRRAMPPEFSPAADAAGAGHHSPCPQALQGQPLGGGVTPPLRSHCQSAPSFAHSSAATASGGSHCNYQAGFAP